MRRTMIFGLIAGIFLVVSLQSVAADACSYDTYSGVYYYASFHDDCDEWQDYRNLYDGYDYRNYGYSPGYYGDYYNRYWYRKYWEPSRYYTKDFDDGDRKYKRKLRYAIRDISEEYDNWLSNLPGRTSGEVYYYEDESVGVKESDWRNKEAYHNLDWAEKPYDKYYYEPRYDSESGVWNWRY